MYPAQNKNAKNPFEAVHVDRHEALCYWAASICLNQWSVDLLDNHLDMTESGQFNTGGIVSVWSNIMEYNYMSSISILLSAPPIIGKRSKVSQDIKLHENISCRDLSMDMALQITLIFRPKFLWLARKGDHNSLLQNGVIELGGRIWTWLHEGLTNNLYKGWWKQFFLWAIGNI